MGRCSSHQAQVSRFSVFVYRLWFEVFWMYICHHKNIIRALSIIAPIISPFWWWQIYFQNQINSLTKHVENAIDVACISNLSTLKVFDSSTLGDSYPCFTCWYVIWWDLEHFYIFTFYFLLPFCWSKKGLLHQTYVDVFKVPPRSLLPLVLRRGSMGQWAPPLWYFGYTMNTKHKQK